MKSFHLLGIVDYVTNLNKKYNGPGLLGSSLDFVMEYGSYRVWLSSVRCSRPLGRTERSGLKPYTLNFVKDKGNSTSSRKRNNNNPRECYSHTGTSVPNVRATLRMFLLSFVNTNGTF